MSGHHRVRGAGRGHLALTIACIAGSVAVSGCSGWKQSLGLEPSMPDEFAVESRAPLTIPPDFDLRPPEPGAQRPQEKSMAKQAEQVIDQAGPGEPGKQASTMGLHRAAEGLPDIGTNAQSPDPNAMVADQSLSSKLLGAGDTGPTGATVQKRETTPLSGVY
jgi:Protein of unknown function (DUF3035)